MEFFPYLLLSSSPSTNLTLDLPLSLFNKTLDPVICICPNLSLPQIIHSLPSTSLLSLVWGLSYLFKELSQCSISKTPRMQITTLTFSLMMAVTMCNTDTGNIGSSDPSIYCNDEGPYTGWPQEVRNALQKCLVQYSANATYLNSWDGLNCPDADKNFYKVQHHYQNPADCARACSECLKYGFGFKVQALKCIHTANFNSFCTMGWNTGPPS